ncbi:tripartite motif-containing protein 59 isoform X2 [Pleurodeles waltl]|uniref:tripartite motif-containing protein 59 isoform X2 n=1 Tax=Pleurodeles waltl TaxID=8319 RepID=UPI0037097F45
MSQMNNLEEELTCCICYNLYEDPRVLPCSHTFCRSCLESVVQSSSNYSIWRPIRLPLKCPTCRSIAELPPTGIGALPANFALRAIIEKYSKENNQDILTCPDHSRQPLNVYCLLDRKLVCGHCLTVGQHQGHPIDDIQSAYIKEKDTPRKLMELLSDKQWTKICDLIDSLEERKSESMNMVQEQKKEALQYFKKINEAIETKKYGLLGTLNDINTRMVVKYDTQIEKMKEIQEEQLELVSLCSSVQEEDSPLIFLERINDIRIRVKSLRKQKLLSVNHVELYPRVEHVLKNQWSKTEIGEIDKLTIPKIEICSKEEAEKKSNVKKKSVALLTVTFLLRTIFLSMLLILMMILLDTTVIFPVLNETSLMYITEIMQTISNYAFSKVQAARSTFDCISDVLLEFIRKLISYFYGSV